MKWTWIRERPPYWDEPKARIVGGAPPGSLPPMAHAPGQILPGEWWRVEEDGEVVGYGWMDHAWGDAEVLLAVAPERQGRGIGAFILDRLEDEARALGVNYIYNVVRETHPARERVTRWLEGHGFRVSHEDNLMRRRVRRVPGG